MDEEDEGEDELADVDDEEEELAARGEVIRLEDVVRDVELVAGGVVVVVVVVALLDVTAALDDQAAAEVVGDDATHAAAVVVVVAHAAAEVVAASDQLSHAGAAALVVASCQAAGVVACQSESASALAGSQGWYRPSLYVGVAMMAQKAQQVLRNWPEAVQSQQHACSWAAKSCQSEEAAVNSRQGAPGQAAYARLRWLNGLE